MALADTHSGEETAPAVPSTAGSPAAAAEPVAGSSGPPVDRLRLYGYLSAPEAADYLAIMGRFTGALLAEWSAQDLVDRGLGLAVETAEARCRYLVDHGNLLLSPREVRVTSIAEYQRQPARYTISALGARLHREVEVFLAVTGGVQEVPRELLALVADGLAALADGPGRQPSSADAGALAGAVSTVFGQFHEFANSVTDFYTYIGSVLARADLDGDEWLGFKSLLLDYLETIVESVRRYGPAVEAALARMEPSLPALVERLGTTDVAFSRLQSASPGGEEVGRARGRSISDWYELRDWFSAAEGGRGARQLREAAGRAVGALLASLKRLNATSTRETSQRRHFLKLARWFDAADPSQAHVLFTSAFGLYGARHLGVPLDDEVAEAVPATASWWWAPPAPVPVSLRERGDRNPRGRVARIVDHGGQKQHLAAARFSESEQRAAACSELLAAGEDLAGARLTPAAMAVLLELLGTATASMAPGSGLGTATLPDHPVTLWLWPSTRDVTVGGEDGSLTLRAMATTVLTPGQRPVADLRVGVPGVVDSARDGAPGGRPGDGPGKHREASA